MLVKPMEKTKTTNHIQEYMCCYTCGFKLRGRAYEIDGKLYCEIDFKRKFAPRCEECSDFIIGVRENYIVWTTLISNI